MSPSIDDSGPYMVNYSIACGTPVISFPIGVALDLVIPHQTGYLAKYLDSDDMAKGIIEFYTMSEHKYKMISDNCIRLINQLLLDNIPWYLMVLD